MSLLPIYLAALRKQSGFTQPELASLLSLTPSGLCKLETGVRCPTVEVVLGSEVIFGKPAREIYPKLFNEIEDGVVAEAKGLFALLEARDDISSGEKLKLLSSLIKRAEAHDPTLWRR